MPLKVDSVITNSVIVNGAPIGLPYKVYTAILTYNEKEVKIDANILQNTIGDIVWSIIDKGKYSATLIGAFTAGKVYVTIETPNDYSIEYKVDNLTFSISTLSNTPIEIRVYS